MPRATALLPLRLCVAVMYRDFDMSNRLLAGKTAGPKARLPN
jgi:hypothetical protein